MSLRDCGVFAPLEADHPIAKNGDACWLCGGTLGAGDRVSLVPVETPDQNGGDRTVHAEPVHATCALKGREIVTPKGLRVVESIKAGDGSPFPVNTCGGEQWRDEEVSPVERTR